MQEYNFLTFLKHFANPSKVNMESKRLLLLDDHTSHLSFAVIGFCKVNGIVMLIFPPHTSHKLEPLDQSVYGTVKKMINTVSDFWMRMNPGKIMTINGIPDLVKTELPAAPTLKNIQAGFQCCGIWPFNIAALEEWDFAPLQLTDRQNCHGEA